MPVDNKILDATRQTTYNVVTLSAGPYDVNFPVFSTVEDLEVYLDQVLNTDWIFAGTFADGVSLDATITFNSAITGQVDIVGARNPHRVTQYIQGKGVPAATHNLSLNILTAIARELYDKVGRAVIGAVGDSAALQLPKAADRLGKIFGFSASTGAPELLDAAAFTGPQGPQGPGGNFTGPGSAVDNNLVGFDGVTGALGKDSGIPAAQVPRLDTAATFTQTLTVEGAFTSPGIDDNASAERMELTDTQLKLGTTTTSFVVRNMVNDQSTHFTGGNASSVGGSFLLYGGAHVSRANDIRYISNNVDVLEWDNSESNWDFQGKETKGIARLELNDANFYAEINSGDTDPRITFDANDYLKWERSSNTLRVVVNTSARFSVSGVRITLGTVLGLKSYTVGTLPTGAVGDLGFAIDLRNGVETAGNGTGGPVYFANSQWRRYEDNAVAAA